MNKLLVLLAGVFLSIPGFAMTGSYGVSSDYMWRGISQTDGNPSIWACLDQNIGKGFYVGGCAMNVDFNDDAKVETDLYGGYSVVKNKFNMNLGYAAYRYDDSAKNFEEKYMSVGYGPIKVGKFYGQDLAPDYEWVDLNLPFLNFADVTLHYGDYDGVLDKSVNIEYSLSDSMSIGVLVQSDIRDSDVDLGDAVSLHFTTKF